MAARPFTTADRVCVAQIGGAHGVRGELRLRPFTQDPASVTQYGPLETDNGQRFEITAARPAKDALVVRFKGVDDRAAAEALRHVKLYVPRERLGDAAENEFFHADLIGLSVVTVTGVVLGAVTAIPNFGAGDLLEIASADGGASILLPFTKAVVPVVDIASGTITVDPPDGAFETSAELFPSPLAGG